MFEINKLRTHIADLKSQVRQIEELPRTQAETEALIRRHLQTRFDVGARELKHHMAVFHAGDRPDGFLAGSGGDIGAALLPLIGLDAAMRAILPFVEHLPEGIKDADRAAQLADLAADLLQCEIAEEAAVGVAEARGEEVSRRPDADPRAVLLVAT